MRSNRLGCLTGTGIIAALITAFAIAGYAYARGGLMYNPGPLSAQGDETLGGVTSHAATGGNCEACHTAPWEAASMADRCTACHTDIAGDMRNVATVHGTLMHDEPDLGCRHCHPEHRGPDAQLTVFSDASFPHEVVGFSLKGHPQTAADEPFVCDDCHAGDITTFDLKTCDTCHREEELGYMTAHTLSFGSDCLDCHDGVDRLGKNFDHNVFSFQLTGQHVGLACVQCHVNARGFGDFAVTLQDCNSCHHAEEPHEGRFGLDCGECHTAEGWSPAKFDHNLSVFKLEGEHAEAECDECHVDRQFKGTPMDCYACHQEDDEHNGEYGTDCSVCHTPSDWEDADFDHNLTKFPLIGGHAGVGCQECHSSGQFAGLSRTCVNCHGDPAYHAGLFGQNCVGCHTVNNWSARYDGPHPAISRNHEGAGCRDCHTSTLHSATCSACHDGNEGGDGDGGGDDD